MKSTVIIASSEEVFYQRAAQLMLESVVAAAAERQFASVALSGGSTPKKLYQLLSEPYFKSRMPWNQIKFFWSDERCVPSNHPESNYKGAMDGVLAKIPVPAKNIFRIKGEMESPADAAKAYEQELRLQLKTHEPFPKFDLITLGVGEDGHTASLFSGSAALKEKLHWVAANHVEKLNASRVTLTFPVINNARRVLVLCAGENKATVIKDIFSEHVPLRYPAQQINPVNGELVWLLDKGAAAKLPASVSLVASHI